MATLVARRDSRPLAYAVLAAGALVIGLAAGTPELIALAAGLVTAIAIGLRHAAPIEIDPQVAVETRRLIEGDPLRTSITVSHPPTHVVDLLVTDPSPALGEITYRRTRGADGRTVFELEIETPEWGRHDVGHLVLRAHQPGAMCEWEQRLLDLGEVTVLPKPARLTTLLAPDATRTTAGGHASRLIVGAGYEFVEIRPYAPGDRVRDINWKATARRRTPHVNSRRPERAGDVVLVLDAAADGWTRTEVGSALLQLAGQASWGLARAHLAAQDRVGLLTQQAAGIEWLPPAGGVRAKYMVLETMLGANTTRSRAVRSSIQRHDIPPAALVIAISTLSNGSLLRSLALMRTHGRTVGVLAIDPSVVLADSERLDRASARLASSLFDAHTAYVRRLGLPVVPWRPGSDLDRAVNRLAESTRRAVVGRRAR